MISNERISDADYLGKEESNQAPTAETEHSMFPLTCVNILPIFSLGAVRLQLDFTNFIGNAALLVFFFRRLAAYLASFLEGCLSHDKSSETPLLSNDSLVEIF